jgi:hypothetical protein
MAKLSVDRLYLPIFVPRILSNAGIRKGLNRESAKWAKARKGTNRDGQDIQDNPAGDDPFHPILTILNIPVESGFALSLLSGFRDWYPFPSVISPLRVFVIEAAAALAKAGRVRYTGYWQ